MKRIEEEHLKIVSALKEIKSSIEEMRETGLGGDDFEGMYLHNRLIPTIIEIFADGKNNEAI